MKVQQTFHRKLQSKKKAYQTNQENKQNKLSNDNTYLLRALFLAVLEQHCIEKQTHLM
jgi:hypothetical protein